MGRGDLVKWETTIQAAISVGATVDVGISSEKPLIFQLPRDDMTFKTRHFHPMGREIFDVVSGEKSPFIEVSSTHEVKRSGQKRKSCAIGNLFILDSSKRKFLRSFSDQAGKNMG